MFLQMQNILLTQCMCIGKKLSYLQVYTSTCTVCLKQKISCFLNDLYQGRHGQKISRIPKHNCNIIIIFKTITVHSRLTSILLNNLMEHNTFFTTWEHRNYLNKQSWIVTVAIIACFVVVACTVFILFNYIYIEIDNNIISCSCIVGKTIYLPSTKFYLCTVLDS